MSFHVSFIYQNSALGTIGSLGHCRETGIKENTSALSFVYFFKEEQVTDMSALSLSFAP